MVLSRCSLCVEISDVASTFACLYFRIKIPTGNFCIPFIDFLRYQIKAESNDSNSRNYYSLFHGSQFVIPAMYSEIRVEGHFENVIFPVFVDDLSVSE